MGISINDIAKAAGVSKATVSRVINDSESIKPETRSRVLKVMEELDYSPNLQARGLSRSRIYNIALLIDIGRKEYFNPFFYEVMHGIEAGIMDRGYSLIIVSTTKEDGPSQLDAIISEKRIAGVLIPSSLADRNLISTLNSRHFPFVVIGEIENVHDFCSWVDINNRQGAVIAVHHLADMGYQRIAFLSGPEDQLFNRRRREGYSAAILQLPATSQGNYLSSCDGTKADACARTRELLNMKPAPDAIVCGDNVISYGAILALEEKGLKIPRDFGLVTFDSYPLAEILEPGLTSVDIDLLQLGNMAASSLLTMIESPDAHSMQSVISTTLEYRESSAGKKHE